MRRSSIGTQTERFLISTAQVERVSTDQRFRKFRLEPKARTACSSANISLFMGDGVASEADEGDV